MMADLGTQAAAASASVRRTVGDCGASSNRPNGSFMPEAVSRRACDAGMLNTAGMLFIFTNTTKLSHINTHVRLSAHTHAHT